MVGHPLPGGDGEAQRRRRRSPTSPSPYRLISTVDSVVMTTPTTPRPLPKAARYIAPLIRAIRELGGSARPDEATAVIARDLHISEAEQSEPLPSGGQTRFENQIQWARFYLAKA